ncbi:MAG TPA: CDP-alcohol phosphatidyltransferase family protein [Gordonia sp. (in: high G+C Gram-positive bacteria)]|uniref:phosphatidylinositol phosphate synthase n=1 Tax=unclassified Gordonia (in: high G+C Gram-positive bacteria) TaxID=2657482 RepID=UPI000FC19BB5|nr:MULTISPECIES: CDP-alcohol phosphatidyltransferase family protein [unclassified Gordonia (in: high G+C Gram-positive bacteria)]RUP35769.1 MAG: CDP-alcohol phosphatidyltransferase family protein [Gordonia sp. (in: high G+C Gram-positive bacteria)]HNP57764.1 CDP-alcohol phosphatidyltransferase family protein [Gordonia sp. (in: high G+C Gram-positive bacteria)]HRC50454.1 CDP-alcohol phosphatidyltransferase family protein [Gordonia sp. (in: high G+C Gram-positive bacteria)]
MISFKGGRQAVSKVTDPIGRALLRIGLTPDMMTVMGTVITVVAAIVLFGNGYLFAGALVCWAFVMLDMVDGAMARARGWGTRFGAVLDSTCDRIADGAIFGALAWWAAVVSPHRLLLVATLICLVTSQVISYAKSRAEAAGLNGDGGWIERPERLIIGLTGAGLTDFPGLHLTWAIHIAMWALAVLSVITVGQRMWNIHNSPGARDPLVATAADSGDQSAAGTDED